MIDNQHVISIVNNVNNNSIEHENEKWAKHIQSMHIRAGAEPIYDVCIRARRHEKVLRWREFTLFTLSIID